jgi:hypothetical protein
VKLSSAHDLARDALHAYLGLQLADKQAAAGQGDARDSGR